jgi:hypothetical protein
VPVGVAAPAVVDRVPRPARQVPAQVPAGRAVPDRPVDYSNKNIT